ncbi:MAG: AraC family transcriptional regulator [Mariniblastus sp.]
MHKSQSILRMFPQLGGMEHLSASLSFKRFPVHFHDTFVVQLIRSGADWCSTNDIVAQTGEVFVHFPFASHDGGTLEDRRLEYEAIYPSMKLVAELTGLDPSQIPTGKSWATNSKCVVRSVSKLFGLLSSNADEQKLVAAGKQAFFKILESGAESAGHPTSKCLDQKLILARNYLTENAAHDVSIEELSKQCCVSKFHLIRAFKKRFGITPRQFLISHRVTIAKQLMISGIPLTQAAFAAGFNDQSHLTRCFKKLTTCSPGQFRSAAFSRSL